MGFYGRGLYTLYATGPQLMGARVIDSHSILKPFYSHLCCFTPLSGSIARCVCALSMTAVQSRLVVIIDSLNSVIRHSSFVNGLLITGVVSLTKGTLSTILVARGYAPVRNGLNRYFGRNKVVDGRIQSKTNQSARENWFILAEISADPTSLSDTKGEKETVYGGH